MRTDFRSIEELWVFKDSRHVAKLRRLAKGCEFRYERAFLDSSEQSIALHLPKTEEPLTVEGLSNLPTYFAGLLPEGVMFSAVRRLIGAAADDLFAILAATGAEAIGDIEARIPGEPERLNRLNLAQASELIKSLLSSRRDFPPEHLAAISGVQPKLSLGELVRASRNATYIAKFEHPDFPGLIQNEAAFMRLARLCRVEVPDTRLEQGALVVTRFDRLYDKQTKTASKLHVEDMLQVMDLFPNSKYSLEFVDLMRAMQLLGVSKATLLDAMRLYVYSYIIGNGDLHAKNVSLTFDKSDQQWRLSPGYDLLTTLPYRDQLDGADRMALALDDESFGRFSVEEFVQFGAKFELPPRAVEMMIRRVATLVLRHLAPTTHKYLSAEFEAVIRSRAESLL